MAPLTSSSIPTAVGVQALKLRPLLYALVVAGLLTIKNDLFSNSAEAKRFLVRGELSYLGGSQKLVSNNWTRLLETAQTIRAGGPPVNSNDNVTGCG